MDYPKYLMQSVNLTYARYRYLTEEENIDVSPSNARILFIGSKPFKKRFGFSNAELLEKYNYKKDENLRVLKYKC